MPQTQVPVPVKVSELVMPDLCSAPMSEGRDAQGLAGHRQRHDVVQMGVGQDDRRSASKLARNAMPRS
jgi:hypothetical protein